MYRVEDKFICSERDMLLLQSRVKVVLNPDRYSRNTSYKVTSLYFDDYDDNSLVDSEDGVSHRNKYRIRMYNGTSDLIKFEVKNKLYSRVQKQTCIITKEQAKRLIAGECISDTVETLENPITLFNLAIRRNVLRPKVVVEYDRNAYVFSPGNVRITFDRNIRCSKDIDKFTDNLCEYTMLDENNRILEMKYDEFLPRFIAQLIESGGMQQTSYSKYTLCRKRMGDY